MDSDSSQLWTAQVVGHLTPEEAKRLKESRLVITDETVVHRDYSGLRLSEFCSIRSSFTDCRFESMIIDTAAMGSGTTMSLYRNCSFDHTRIRGIAMGLARFEHCSFESVVLNKWSLNAADIIDCTFSGKLTHCIFWGSPPPFWGDRYGKTSNEFSGNDFSGCKMVDTDFRWGVNLALQTLPSGPDYLYVEDGRAALSRAFPIVCGWMDEREKRIGLDWLKLLQNDVENGQTQLFINGRTGRLAQIWPKFRAALEGRV